MYVSRFIATVLLGSAFVVNAHADSDPLFRWVQLVPNVKMDGTPDVMIKVIMDAKDSCPSLHVDNKAVLSLTPTKRSKPAGFDQVQLCEGRIPQGDPLVSKFQQASLDNQGKHTLPLPDLSQGVPLSQFIAFGCTGCRQKKDEQDKCNHKDWPFPEVLKDANNQAANGKMAAVVSHLGDMRYAGQKKEPDSWTLSTKNIMGWQEEFFKPAHDLLKSNWWIIMRGNHEACLIDPIKQTTKQPLQDRGSAWFYFFDDQNNTCEQVLNNQGDVVPAYALDATIYNSEKSPTKTTTRLVVMDMVRTGDERDRDAVESKKLYAAQFDTVASKYANSDRPLWLLGHIPMFSFKGEEFEDTVILDAANASQLAGKMDKSPLTVAAHVHEFQLINAMAGNPTAKRPLQYIVGNGGVLLSGKAKYQTGCMRPTVSWTPIGETTTVSETWAGEHKGDFGYFLASFDKDGNAKLAPRFYNLDKEEWSTHKSVTCEVQGKDGKVVCSQLPKSDSTPECPK